MVPCRSVVRTRSTTRLKRTRFTSNDRVTPRLLVCNPVGKSTEFVAERLVASRLRRRTDDSDWSPTRTDGPLRTTQNKVARLEQSSLLLTRYNPRYVTTLLEVPFVCCISTHTEPLIPVPLSPNTDGLVQETSLSTWLTRIVPEISTRFLPPIYKCDWDLYGRTTTYEYTDRPYSLRKIIVSYSCNL